MYVESDGYTHASLTVGKKSSTTQVCMRMHTRTHTHSLTHMPRYKANSLCVSNLKIQKSLC